MNVGVPELIIVFFAGGYFLALWGIIDAAVRPDDVWAAAQQNKLVWVLIQIFLGAIGAVVYFAVIRPKLTAAAARLVAGSP